MKIDWDSDYAFYVISVIALICIGLFSPCKEIITCDKAADYCEFRSKNFLDITCRINNVPISQIKNIKISTFQKYELRGRRHHHYRQKVTVYNLNVVLKNGHVISKIFPIDTKSLQVVKNRQIPLVRFLNNQNEIKYTKVEDNSILPWIWFIIAFILAGIFVYSVKQEEG